MRAFLMSLLLLAACSEARTPSATIGQPIDAGPPNASQQTPAFPQQTRAPALAPAYALQSEIVADNLEHPWGMEFLPDGRMLFTERPGRLRIATSDGALSAPIRGLPRVDARGQGGLLDVALSPNFASDRLIYWSYAEPRGDENNGTSVARGRLNQNETQLEDVQVIFRQQPAWDSTLHFGSRLVWAPDGTLFITLGERSVSDARPYAQNLQADLGKIVRINADGSIPRDNPFVGRQDARPEIWSYGHRNVQGAAINPATSRLWTIEHGAKGGDELNAPQAGRNYGWPIITYGEEYSGLPIGEGITARQGLEQPIYYWDPVIAPSGLLFYTGALFSDWRGDVLTGSLTPGGLVRLKLNGERVVGEERMLGELGRVRDVVQGPDGAIWLLIDHESRGRIVRVTPRA
jgi:glucose/arabinose dehydrogenase